MPETFQNFGVLALELRLKIWELASFIPRNVDVWNMDIFVSKGNGEQAHLIPHRMLSRRPPPAILHVCSESRQEALRHYILEFGAQKDAGSFVLTSKPRIYINPAVDTVCLPRPDAFLLYVTENTDDTVDSDRKKQDFVDKLEKMKLRSLAINLYNHRQTCWVEDDGTAVSGIGDIIPTEGALTELILFSDPSCYTYGWGETTSQSYSDLINFRDLCLVGLEIDRPPRRLMEGSAALEAYFSPISLVAGPTTIAFYQSLRKRLCKVDGKWAEVEEGSLERGEE